MGIVAAIGGMVFFGTSWPMIGLWVSSLVANLFGFVYFTVGVWNTWKTTAYNIWCRLDFQRRWRAAEK